MPTVKHRGPLDDSEPDPSQPLTTEVIKRVFRARVLKRLAVLNWTQSELGRRSGLPRDFISTYLRDPPRSMPTSLNVAKIARALGMKTSELMPLMGDIETNVPPMEMIGTPEDGFSVRINITIPLKFIARFHELVKEVQADSDAA
jgi:transcriptional regulator with XRE-family HTH domain